MACGIDFGTTNTALVHFEEKRGRTLLGDTKYQDESPLPSIVAINKKTGEIKVGKEVKENIKTLSDDYHIVLSIKTILDDIHKSWPVGDKKLTTEDVASEIFKRLKQSAKQRNIDIKESVVAVPVNFAASKKYVLEKATRKAGIEIKKFISEPTAAFLAHYEELKSYKNVVVFDWGGGTLDISALEVENGSIREIYTDNLYKAGDDIDKEFARTIYENMLRNGELAPIPFEELPVKEYDELLTKAEAAKIKLSNEFVSKGKTICTLQGKQKTIEFNDTELEKVAEKYVDEAIEKLTNVVTRAFSDTVSCILCVGGSSKLKLLRNNLKKIYGNKLYFPDNPQWDIAEGACTVLTSKKNNIYKLSDEIKIKLSNGTYMNILEKGQPLPCKETQIYLATTDSSENANFIFRIGYKEFPVSIPLLGGVDEVLKLFAYIDEYNILHIDIENSKTNERYNIFNYEKVDICYNL